MKHARSLVSLLVRRVGLATLAGLVSFVALVLLVLAVDEDPSPPGEESQLEELIEHLLVASVIAAPISMTLSIVVARWSARAATRPLDRLTATASSIDLDRLGVRLPASSALTELDALADALNSLVDRIERGVAAQRRFAADASHELRTPIAVVISTLEVARRRVRTVEEWERIADTVLLEARQLADLSRSLLQTSRIAAHAVEPTFEEVDSMVGHIVERLRPRARAADVDVVIRGAALATIEVDVRAFGVALTNLVNNAITWSPRGTTIEVELSSTTGEVEISVDDEGPGIAESDRAVIFQPFVRGEQPTTRGGAGLGLAIVRRICEASGASAEATRSLRGGARFTLRFPRAR